MESTEFNRNKIILLSEQKSLLNITKIGQHLFYNDFPHKKHVQYYLIKTAQSYCVINFHENDLKLIR